MILELLGKFSKNTINGKKLKMQNNTIAYSSDPYLIYKPVQGHEEEGEIQTDLNTMINWFTTWE